MEPDEEMYPDVRPKRETRRPARFQDFEVDYMGYRQRDLSQWALPSPTREGRVYSPQESAVQMTPFQTSLTHSCGFHGNAAHHEIPQLAPTHHQRRSLDSDNLPGYTPSHLQSPYLDLRLHKDMRAIQEENASLLQSRQALQSGIKELNEARSELKELIEIARSLRANLS